MLFKNFHNITYNLNQRESIAKHVKNELNYSFKPEAVNQFCNSKIFSFNCS